MNNTPFVAPASEEETDDSKTEIDEVESEEDEPRRAKKPKKGGLVIRLTPLAKKGKGKKKVSATQECSQLFLRTLDICLDSFTTFSICVSRISRLCSHLYFVRYFVFYILVELRNFIGKRSENPVAVFISLEKLFC